MTQKEENTPSINKVTTNNLSVALRLCNIEIHKTVLDKIIDLVELIEVKGDDTNLKDIASLQVEWKNSELFTKKRKK